MFKPKTMQLKKIYDYDEATSVTKPNKQKY